MDYGKLFEKAVVVSFSVSLFWKIIRHMWNSMNVEKEPVKVLVTGAAGTFLLQSITSIFSYQIGHYRI